MKVYVCMKSNERSVVIGVTSSVQSAMALCEGSGASGGSWERHRANPHLERVTDEIWMAKGNPGDEWEWFSIEAHECV